jgi:hypothetical protein
MGNKIRMAERSEFHLFILWEHSRNKEESILDDISKKFKILRTFEVYWSSTNFSSNLSRFYGTNLPPGSSKEEHCGKGPFLLAIVEDKTPRYKMHKTSKGDKSVNTNMFAAKDLHRQWTGGGHRVHATNTAGEFEHDITLLFGLNSADFFESDLYKKSKNRTKIKKDLIGASGWESIQQLFYVLNGTIDYVVLRNFEVLPGNYYSGKHGDIDLLVSNYENTRHVTNSQDVHHQKHRVHNKVMIDSEEIFFDFRFLGDNYYDKAWEKEILNSRKKKNGLYVIDQKNYFYSLMYHGLIHKKEFAKDYQERLKVLAAKIGCDFDSNSIKNGQASKLLGVFLAKHNYSIPQPIDKSVYYNTSNTQTIRKKMWAARPAKYALKRLKRIGRA